MEDENVSPTVELTPERVKKCVEDLNALFDQIEHDFLPKVAAAQSVQTSAQWSDAAPAVEFRTAIRSALGSAEQRLKTLWTDVRELCETLERNAADLEALDTATADSLALLLSRSKNEPEAPEYVPLPVHYGAPPGYTVPAPGTGSHTESPTPPLEDRLGPTPAGVGSYDDQ